MEQKKQHEKNLNFYNYFYNTYARYSSEVIIIKKAGDIKNLPSAFCTYRSDKIWTCDLSPPRRALYQTKPHPENKFCSSAGFLQNKP